MLIDQSLLNFFILRYVQESLVHYDLISNLKFISIDDVTDSYCKNFIIG